MKQQKIVVEPGLSLNVCVWGKPSAKRPVFCVHGLTRNARDFDWLARDLAKDRAVFAVDVVGRGGSDWLDNKDDYRVEQYADHLSSLMPKLGLEDVDWIGTSMGGLIGMLIASSPSAISRMVLNDIGPFVDQAALAPIASYLGLDLQFANQTELEKHLRLIHAGFGPLSDAQWQHLSEHSSFERDGAVRLHYDPDIKQPFLKDAAADIDLWAEWREITMPVLTLRGSESVILTAETADAMTRFGPKAQLITFDGIGHAPSLMAADQIKTIRDWLDQV